MRATKEPTEADNRLFCLLLCANINPRFNKYIIMRTGMGCGDVAALYLRLEPLYLAGTPRLLIRAMDSF